MAFILPSSVLSLGVAAEAKCDRKIKEVEPRRRRKSILGCPKLWSMEMFSLFGVVNYGCSSRAGTEEQRE